MAILGGFRTDQLIGQLVSESDTNSMAAQKTIERLKKIGPKVIPKIIDALAMSDKTHTMVLSTYSQARSATRRLSITRRVWPTVAIV